MLNQIHKDIAALEAKLIDKTTKEDKFLSFLGLSGLTILLSAFFLTLFGFVDLSFPEYTKWNEVFSAIINTVLYLLNMFFVFGIVLQSDLKRTIKYLIIFLPIHLSAVYLIENTILITGFLPILYLVSISKFKLKEILIKYFVLSAVIVIYQQITGFIKFHYMTLHHYQSISAVNLILSIDLILIYAFIYKEVSSNVFSSKLVVFSKSKSVRQDESQSKNPLDVSDLNRRQQIIFGLMVSGYQLFQLLVVLSIGLINNMFVEILIMLPVFWIGRTIMQKSWHSDKLWICSVATFSGFYILTKVTPPLHISLFMVVATTGTFVWLLYYLGVKSERLEELESKYDDDFTKYGLSKEMSNFAYDWKVKGLKDKELMSKYEILSTNTLNSRKRRIKQAMHTK